MSDVVLEHSTLHEIYDHLVHERGICAVGCMTVGNIVEALLDEGILFWRDARFRESQKIALELAGSSSFSTSSATTASSLCISMEDQEAASKIHLSLDDFIKFISPQAMDFLAAFSEELVIPDWATFVQDMTYHFEKTKPKKEGENAQYIPILRDADPEKWALSICSISGQRFSLGDYQTGFSIQSVSKPVTYGLCLSQEGEEEVDKWIGVEPAGRPFNTQDLEPQSQTPFNASVNSGAIMAAGLFASQYPDCDWNQCVDNIRQTWYELSGEDLPIGFSQETFESEKETAYNNIAIAYNLKGRRGLPRDVSIQKMLDVYLGCCSIEMTAESLAIAAATFANGGVCPITHKEVFPAHVVRHVLSETMTCGMYNQAGRFAVEVGLPAKSGVSGALMVIVPNVFGVCTFSPRLNQQGNSVRGLEFCKGLVGSYRVHIFEPLRSGNTAGKIDPRVNGKKDEESNISHFALAYQVGDAWGVRLHEIFLRAMVHVGFSAAEGMSDRIKRAICDEYGLIYQKIVDEALLQKIIDDVNPDPTDLTRLKELKKDRFINDEFRNVILFAIMEIIVVDGNLSQKEAAITLGIATFLGIDQSVALMELDRYKCHVGSRFKEADPFESGNLYPLGNFEEQVEVGSEDEAGHSRHEVLRLRREVFRLRKKVNEMSKLLNGDRHKRTQETRSLSVIEQNK